jgi:anti-sigma-K factor RskA
MSNDPHDLLAAYALDALDDDERERFEAHLADCEECTEQLALLREPVAALAYAAEGPVPPKELRGRIIEGARAEPRAAVIKLPRRNWALGSVAAVAAAAACLAIGLGVYAHSLSNSLDRERGNTSALSKLLENGTAKPLVGANGSLIVNRTGKAAILVCGLANAPSSKTYQAWVITGDSPKPAGLFRGGSGCRTVFLTQPVPTKATVAATLERAGGATSPTLPILFRAEAT